MNWITQIEFICSGLLCYEKKKIKLWPLRMSTCFFFSNCTNEFTPVWGKNAKGDGELQGHSFDLSKGCCHVGPKKPAEGNVCCWDLPIQNILLASHMHTQTNTLTLFLSHPMHTYTHTQATAHTLQSSSSALVSSAWGFPGSKDPFLILQQKHQTKANRMKVQTSSLGNQLCVFPLSQMVAILPKPNVKQKHIGWDKSKLPTAGGTTVSQIKCITFRSKYLSWIFFSLFWVFFCEKEPSYKTLSAMPTDFLKNVSLIHHRLPWSGVSFATDWLHRAITVIYFWDFIKRLIYRHVYIWCGCHKRFMWRDSFADFDLHTPSQSTVFVVFLFFF